MIEILALSFGGDAETPVQHGAGITIAAFPFPGVGMSGHHLVRGACRVARAAARAGRLALPHGIFFTGVDAWGQRTSTAPLVGDRVIFEDDVLVAGDDYVIELRCVVVTARLTAGPTYLHASFFEHVSNVVRVEG
ncbi:MAG: hypothetical protein IT372_04610 [Polyangiaceae bacterium]|nr:hypothetical protein [Polyangiaceae bacterium]